jgi:hypothetical protein
VNASAFHYDPRICILVARFPSLPCLGFDILRALVSNV